MLLIELVCSDKNLGFGTKQGVLYWSLVKTIILWWSSVDTRPYRKSNMLIRTWPLWSSPLYVTWDLQVALERYEPLIQIQTLDRLTSKLSSSPWSLFSVHLAKFALAKIWCHLKQYFCIKTPYFVTLATRREFEICNAAGCARFLSWRQSPVKVRLRLKLDLKNVLKPAKLAYILSRTDTKANSP